MIALIVDKDMDSRIHLKHLIQENAEECCVLEFPDGRQAMDYVSVPGREADFLFTEVELKGMSGFTLCRNMKKLQNQCYLTLMSKKDDYAYEAWLYGADNYLINPLTETGLKLF